MKKLILIYILIIAGLGLHSQDTAKQVEGTVSYITSQHVYVKFRSTEGMQPGDTLFVQRDGRNIPALRVTNISSMSCVCDPLDGIEFAVSDRIFYHQMTEKPEIAVVGKAEAESPAEVKIQEIPDTTGLKTVKKPEPSVDGRISVSSYSNFTNTPSGNSQRMRYTLSLNAENISGTPLSAETYISFSHRSNHWNEVKDNLFNALKIYSLALRYDFNPGTHIWLGRKYSRKIPVMGAVDGVQFEKKIKNFSVGAIAGSRPDYRDYGFNAKLFQAGVYGAHEYNGDNGFAQTSLALVQQMNSGNTDRRFAYLQHANSLIDKVYLYGSAEVDMYRKTAGLQDSKPRLTGIYLMVRYRPVRKLSVSASYSARKNVIYYETYKSIVDRLLAKDALQGYRLSVTYRPFSHLAIGARAGYRNRNDDPRPSKNLYGFITITQIPNLKVSATASATVMQTAWLDGNIYSLRLTRDIIPGKIYGGAGYRYVDYRFAASEATLRQNMAEIDLTWRILKKLYFSVNYEGTFEKNYAYNRLYINLTQRF